MHHAGTKACDLNEGIFAINTPAILELEMYMVHGNKEFLPVNQDRNRSLISEKGRLLASGTL
jgi:hypothetical protein